MALRIWEELWSDARLQACSAGAIGVFYQALGWLSSHPPRLRSDSARIPIGILRTLCAEAATHVGELVAVGLFTPCDGGWFVPLFGEMGNGSLEEREEARARDRDRKKRRLGSSLPDGFRSDSVRIPDGIPPDSRKGREGKGRDLDQGSDQQDPGGGGAPEISPRAGTALGRTAGLRERACRMLLVGYQARYEREAGDAWMAYERNRDAIEQVAAWAVRQAEATGQALDVVVPDLLDGIFADRWMVEHRWPWGRVAKDPASLLRSRSRASGAEEVAEDLQHRLRAVQAERDAATRAGDEPRVERLTQEAIRIMGELKRQGGRRATG